MNTSWTHIIGQARVVDLLQRAQASGRVAHAYLFYGPDGIGKKAVALAFASALQTANLSETEAARTHDHIRRLIHPDVHLHFPLIGDADPEDIAERFRYLAEDPYAEVDFVRRPSLSDTNAKSNKQARYSVTQIQQEVKQVMGFKAHSAPYKIAILTDVDLMTEQAANAFLKLLEEPAPQTVFILTTSRPERLLPTVFSRCQRVRFDALAAEEIATALTTRTDLPASQVHMLARMAGGSYAQAVKRQTDEAFEAQRHLVLTFFRVSFTQNAEALLGLVEQCHAMSREEIKHLLGLMMTWARDLLLAREMPTPALTNVDQSKTIQKFTQALPQADVGRMIELLEEARELIERNVRTDLVFMALSTALHEAMQGRSTVNLFNPLAHPMVYA